MKHDILSTNVVVNASFFWETYRGDILFNPNRISRHSWMGSKRNLYFVKLETMKDNGWSFWLEESYISSFPNIKSYFKT